MTVPEPTGGPAGWRVLAFGRDPEISAAIQDQLRAEGMRARAFALTDDPDGDARLTRELSEASWDGVAIGGFINGQNPAIRPTPQTTLWFNRVLNIIHAQAPGAKIILVREPPEALSAIKRVLGPALSELSETFSAGAVGPRHAADGHARKRGLFILENPHIDWLAAHASCCGYLRGPLAQRPPWVGVVGATYPFDLGIGRELWSSRDLRCTTYISAARSTHFLDSPLRVLGN